MKLTVRRIVFKILRDNPESRNNDIWLIYAFYMEKYNTADYAVFLAKGLKVESPETILRQRRFWQNDNDLFCPSDEVKAERRINERKMRHEMGRFVSNVRDPFAEGGIRRGVCRVDNGA